MNETISTPCRYKRTVNAVRCFLADYTATYDLSIDQDAVECVINAVDEALGDRLRFGMPALLSRLEGSSKYVASDLSAEELDAYVESLVCYLESEELL